MTDDPSLYAERHGQKAEDHPAEVLPAAEVPACPEHPEEPTRPGMGYAGGGFGTYRRCSVCGRVVQKRAIKDGNG